MVGADPGRFPELFMGHLSLKLVRPAHAWRQVGLKAKPPLHAAFASSARVPV
jgi:hypothetical protein